MTVAGLRMIIDDIDTQGSAGYHSPLLDRLCDYFNVPESASATVPDEYSALSRIEILAAIMCEERANRKRHLAGFTFPHLFDLARSLPGSPHDVIAAQVVSASVRYMSKTISSVSETLAAFTADNPNSRERLGLVVTGAIATNPLYRDQLAAALSEGRYIELREAVSDGATKFSELAMHYLRSSPTEKRVISRSVDPLHQVFRLT